MKAEQETNEQVLAFLEKMDSKIENHLWRLSNQAAFNKDDIERRLIKLETYYKALLLLAVDKSEAQNSKTVNDILTDIRDMKNKDRWELLEEIRFVYFDEDYVIKSQD